MARMTRIPWWIGRWFGVLPFGNLPRRADIVNVSYSHIAIAGRETVLSVLHPLHEPMEMGKDA